MTIITSYNLKWNSNNDEVKNILLNIKKVMNTYDIDFLLFQEAAIYNKLISIIDKKKYNYHLHKSGEEYMITFYKINYEIINVYDSEFESGRPFSLFLFKNKFSKNKFYLTNLHAGHHANTELSIIKPIEDIARHLKNNTNIFILGGDFNRNIITDIFIKTKNTTYKLKNIINNEKTCCSSDIYKLKYNLDHIISTSTPIKKIVFKKYYPASDHMMIVVELKDI